MGSEKKTERKNNMTREQLHSLASDVRHTADRLASLTIAAAALQHPSEWREDNDNALADVLTSLEAAGMLAGRFRANAGHRRRCPDPAQGSTPPAGKNFFD